MDIKNVINSLAKNKKVKTFDVLEVVAKALKVKVDIKKTVRAIPIYQYPNNTRKTWSGKSPKPAWVKE